MLDPAKTAAPADASPWRDRLTRIALALVSTVGMVLCCAPHDQWWLGFVAWIPLFFAIEGVRPGAALFYGWVTGCFTVFWGFFWITELLTRFAEFPLAGAAAVAFLFAAYHGLLWGGAAALIAWIRARSDAPLWIVAPLCWVVFEALLPNIFPIYMALGWASAPLLIQTAELGGVTTVSFVMVAINAGLYTVARQWWWEEELDRPAAIFTAALSVGVPVYGAVRIMQVEARMEAAPKLDIGVVQGNMGIDEMHRRREKPRILDQQRRMSAALEAEGADLVLWGETAYPFGRTFYKQSQHEPPEGHDWRIHEGFTVPALVGVITRDATGEQPYPWNTALLIGSDGAILESYDKVYRLVFGEYAPIVDPEWYLRQIPNASYIAKGDGAEAMELGDWRLGPLICYEDILPRYVRETAQQDVHVFVNLTNDAWFGDSKEPHQHLGLALFRAVEHRKPLVRSVTTGVSAYVDPTGRTHEETDVTDPDVEGPQEADGFVVSVPMMDPEARTLYGRTGELFNVLCLLAVLGLAIRGRRD